MKEVFLNECNMSVMARYPDKYFDLAIVDPPYGLPKGSTNGRGKLKNRIMNTGNIEKWDIVPEKQYFDQLFRVSKNQIIWGGNYFDLPPTRCILCWDKVQPWENFSQIEIAWTSFQSPAQIFKFDNRTGDKIHPTQKPVRLYDWILNKYAQPNFKILDTHLGSGSSAIAAHKYGINEFVGCEIDIDYFNDFTKRYNLVTSQTQLF